MKKQTEESLQSRNEKLKGKLKKSSASLKLMKRDAAIEVALERVRARAMAMQKSDETFCRCI